MYTYGDEGGKGEGSPVTWSVRGIYLKGDHFLFLVIVIVNRVCLFFDSGRWSTRQSKMHEATDDDNGLVIAV